MTKRQNRVLFISLIFVLSLPALAFADPPSLVGRLNLAEGMVSFRPGSLDEWAPAVLNYPLSAGDHLWTDDGSRAELHVGSTAMRLDMQTEISFLNLDDRIVQVGVSQGQLNVRLRRLDPGEIFEIDTPNSVLTLLEAGSYSISVQGEEYSSLTVWRGQAEVTAAGIDFRVQDGQAANITGNDYVSYYLQSASIPDAWDEWYASRDAREDQLASIRYVPREMIGIEDLDTNGSWIEMAGYGPVWAPTRVAPGWAPYKFGRWAWVAPWGWTWIDDAPWGFAPFHYGRWAFANNHWVWIPGAIVARPVYAPALVVFIGGWPGDSSAEGIGWFPLGPREVYVPPYRASTTYVQHINITTVNNITVQNIEHINVTQVTYVNRGVPSAVTVVPRKSFTQGHPAAGAATSISTDQVRRAPILGMGATIAPQRESIISQPSGVRKPAPQPPSKVAGRNVVGRIVPAPAPALFKPRSDPPSPATMYQRPPRQAAPPQAPVRQKAPIVIKPMNRAPVQVQPQRSPQQPAPVVQPQQPRRVNPQPQPAPVVQPQRAPKQQPVVQQPPQRPVNTQSQAPGEAQSLLNNLKLKTLPDVQNRLESARKMRGVKLDYAALSRQLDTARSTIAGAESALSSGKSDVALQQAQAVQRQLADEDRLISDAMKSGGGD